MLMKSVIEPREGPPDPARLRRLEFHDLRDALQQGWADFVSFPSFAVLIAVIYPILGLIIARVLHGYSFLPLLFPIAAGFALLGPFAAVVFYDLSRRRALGQSADDFSIRDVASSPSRTGIAALGGVLALLFLIWLGAAQGIYNSFYGFAPVSSMGDFVAQVATTSRGITFLILMCGTGFVFALVSFCISVVSFPMLLDRKASATDAMLTSYRVIVKSPIVLLGWGGIVAVLLIAGSIPAFLGLAIAVPVLGHATWHLYRRAVP
jgi:uncharacterized membrane protein